MKREQIFEIAHKEFTTYGVKRVSMDEIVQKMRISKKTIYELFGNKEQLAKEAFSYKTQQVMDRINSFIIPENNSLYVIIKIGVEIFKVFNPISDAYYDDLKIYPTLQDAHKSFFERSHAKIMEQISLGIKDGLLSPNENYELLGPLIKSQIINDLQVENSGKYTQEQICKGSLIIIFKGVCTPKGREILQEIEKTEI